MAKLVQDIVIIAERRACYVNGRRAIFHKWVERMEAQVFTQTLRSSPPPAVMQLKDTFALVEYENGEVEEVRPQDIQFADGGSFGELCFFPPVEKSTDQEVRKK